MSQTIDQKVVEMKFDNSNFETNVKQSMSTLDKLKKELDLEGSAEGFKQLSKAAKDVSFESLSKSVDEVKVHFSALQTVATTALATITSQAVQTGMAMAKSLTIDLTGAGFNQYEKKTQSVQTIMNATGKDIDSVNASLDKLIWFADETSYSFSDMVDNVGKFTSVGVDLDDASRAMMGISNWAAVSGQNAQTASRAMYNLSQAMGLGYVGLMDWKSIELANMATKDFKQQVIDTAIAMGKLQQGQVTVENFRESLKDKWFDNDVLMQVLGNYGDYTELVYERVQETGELCAEAMKNVADQMGGSYAAIGEKALKAAQEAKTFTDAVDATKDAVKSQWANLFELAFGNYEEARVTFTNLANTLWEVFAAPLSDINETVSEAMAPPEIDLAQWRNLRKDMGRELGLTGSQWTEFEEVIKQVAKDSGLNIDEIIAANYGSFEASLTSGWLNTDIIQEAYDRIVSGTATAGKSLDEYQDIVNRVWNGEFGNGEERRSLLEAAGYNYEEIQRLVELGYGAELTMEDLGDSASNLITLYGTDLAEAFKNGGDGVQSFQEILNTMSGADLRNGIWDNLFNSDTGAVVTYVTTIRDAFADIFGTIDSGTIHDMLAGVYEWTLKLLQEERIERFKTTVENIFHAVHSGINIIKGAFSVIKAVYNNTVGPILSGLWEIVKAIASGIGSLFAQFDKATSETTVFATAVDWLNKTLAPVKRMIEAISGGIVTFINSLFSGEGVLESFKDAVDNVIDTLFGKDVGFNKKYQFRQFYSNLVGLKETVSTTFKNIGKLFSDFWKAIQNTELGKQIAAFAETVKNAFEKAWEAVKTWFKNITGNLGGDTDIFTTIQGSLNKFNEWMANLDIDNIAEHISSSLIGFKDKIKGAFTSVRSWFENNDTASNVISFVKDKFNSLRDAIAGDKDDQEPKKPFIQRVLDGIKSALEWFKDNLPDLIETFKGLLGGGVLGSLILLILQIKRMFGSGGGIVKGVAKVLTGLGSALKAFAFKQIAEGVSMLAASFALILGVIGAIAYFVDPAALKATGEAIFVISLGLALLATAIGSVIKAINSGKDNKPSGKDLLFESIGSGLKSLGEGAGAYLKYKGVATMLVSVAVALGVMTAAVAILANLNTEQLIQGLASVLALLTMLTVAMKVMTAGNNSSFSLTKQGITSNQVGSLGNGLGFIGLATAILILVGTIAKVNEYNLEEILKGMAVITLIMAEMTAMTRLSSKGFGFSNGAGLLLSALSIKLFVSTLGQIRKYNLEDILKGVLTLGAILLEVSVFSRLVSKSIDPKSSAALILLAVAIEIFSASVKKLSDLSFNKLSNGLLSMVVILTTVAGFTWVISKISEDTEALGNVLTGIAAIIAAVAAAIWVVSDAISKGVNLSEVGKGIGELAVSLVDGLVQAIVGSADSIISGILQLLGSLIDYVPQMVDMLVTLFVDVLNALSERMPEIATAVANFCGALINSFADAFKDVDTTPLINALNEILFATLSLTLIGKFGSIKTLSKGILMLAEVIGAFGVIIAAFGALNLIPGFKDFMAGGAEVLITIANGIGGFFGALIGSFVGQAVESFSSNLPAVASNLSDFMTNLEPFITSSSKIDDSFSDSVGRIVEAMLMITGASFLQGITDALSIFTGGNDIVGYMGKFKELAQALVDFSSVLSGNIDTDAVTAATNASQAITALTMVAPREGGLWNILIAGSTNLSAFATNIGELGVGVASFCKSLDGVTINDTTITSAATAIATLTDVAPKDGGLWNLIAGTTDLGSFGTNLGILGQGVADFCSNLQGITVDEGTVTSAATAINTLVDIAPSEGGIWQDIVGTQNLGSFATNVEKLGTALAGFCTEMSGVTVDVPTVEASATAIETLVGIAPSEEGLWNKIAGTKNIGKFSSNLKDLGVGVADFCSALTGVTIDGPTATSAADVIKTLVDIAPNTGGIWQDITGVKDLGNFASNLGTLGQGTAAFCTAVSGITLGETEADSAKKAAEVVKSLTDVAPNTGGLWQNIVGEKDLGNFGDNLGILGSGVASFVESTKNTTKTSITRAEIAANGIIDIMNLPWPTEGGLLNEFMAGIEGVTSFDDLSSMLTSIGGLAATLKTEFADISVEDMTSAFNSTQAIVDLLNLPWPKSDGGISGFFTMLWNGTSQAGFESVDLSALGTAIKGFADSVVGIDPKAIAGARTCGQIISTFISSIPEDASAITNIETYGTTIEGLGTSLLAFSTYVAAINYTMIVLAVAAIKSLISTLDTMLDVDFDKATNFSDALGTLGQAGVNKFTDTFSSSKDKAVKAAEQFIRSVADAIRKAGPQFTSAGDNNVTYYVSGFASSVNILRVAQAASLIMAAIVTIITNSSDSFQQAGEQNLAGYASAFLAFSKIYTTLQNLAITAANYLNQYNSFYVSGQNCMVGAINGMVSYSALLNNTAFTIGLNAVKSFNNGVGSHSPSVYFEESGMNCILGAVNGFTKNAHLLTDTAEETGTLTVDAMSSALKGLDFTNLDDAPVIRPVLDLTAIQNGAGHINEMLHMDTSIGIDAVEAQRLANSIQQLNLAGAEINNTYDDTDVRQSIAELGGRIDALNESILSMGIYLDRKQLVGGIASDMNNALGVIEKKAKKGAM